MAKDDDTGKPRTAIQIPEDEKRGQHQQMADVSLSSTANGGIAAMRWAQKGFGEIGINEAITVVQERADAAASGDLAAAKGMLISQASVLDAVFNQLASRAATLLKVKPDGSWSCETEAMESMMRIAFKAQGQCRATLQTLGELVNPRSVAFIKQAPGSQANVTAGAQQVNNGQQGGTAAPARDSEKRANELLEAIPSEQLDLGTQATTGRANPKLEAVGAVNRAAVGSGEVRQLPKRHKARAA
ncbi:hypothetical protein HK414_13045 [Ramlibacter terrae]|uniref:Phasin family protein n=1 Tax=Ramlibacter terrae TaxID=2732511 RepID=A0ABX6P2S8_9BURK|nr:hypothetical protein HK414_13045 [Ramlibacter terrae]